MFKKVKIIFLTVFTIWAMLTGWVQAGATESTGKDDVKKSGLQQRIDFGNAYIMGQSIKSGAVYLLHRKKSDISSMLKVRTDFRQEIIDDFALEDTELVNKEEKVSTKE